jgi:hypothetical protein
MINVKEHQDEMAANFTYLSGWCLFLLLILLGALRSLRLLLRLCLLVLEGSEELREQARALGTFFLLSLGLSLEHHVIRCDRVSSSMSTYGLLFLRLLGTFRSSGSSILSSSRGFLIRKV